MLFTLLNAHADCQVPPFCSLTYSAFSLSPILEENMIFEYNWSAFFHLLISLVREKISDFNYIKEHMLPKFKTTFIGQNCLSQLFLHKWIWAPQLIFPRIILIIIAFLLLRTEVIIDNQAK